MGIVPLWHRDVLESFSAFNLPVELIETGAVVCLSFGQRNVVLSLLSPDCVPDAAGLVLLQEEYKSKGFYLVHLWEDIWRSRRDQVVGRVGSILGFNERIHGRKTNVIKIGQEEADEFFEAHHLQGTAKAKYRFALHDGKRLVAVAGFSNLRYMKKGGPEYRSAELIRFATRTGYTVTGGFTKLLKHFMELYRPHDVMSYADRDWSLGQAYEKAGFVLSDVTPPAEIWLDLLTLKRYFRHRLPANFFEESVADRYVKIFNTGNLKFMLYLQSASV
ncbi:hypothetical protein [Pedobacter ginsengisoli]|uniref:hypothetical protein n=1 Tax=Pedobacter ginsengisoli TaxID=363852 RepID=UPI0025514BE9|nr:hypothetical protein [Pedobacter ginsengisoli]